MNDQVRKIPLHPIIRTDGMPNKTECNDIFSRAHDVLAILGYLVFEDEEITKEAAEGLFYLHWMIRDSIGYAASVQLYKRKATDQQNGKAHEPKKPHSPMMIGCSLDLPLTNADEVLTCVADVIELFEYLDFTNEEITIPAANGLLILHIMLNETIRYVISASQAGDTDTTNLTAEEAD